MKCARQGETGGADGKEGKNEKRTGNNVAGYRAGASLRVNGNRVKQQHGEQDTRQEQPKH